MKTWRYHSTPKSTLLSTARSATAPSRPTTPPAFSPPANRLLFSFQDISITPEEAETKARERNREAPLSDKAQAGQQHHNDVTLIHAQPIQQPRSRIQMARRGGQPLPSGTQNQLEECMGANLDAVRIHADPEADSLTHLFNARAFTAGPDIFFSQGEYNPSSTQGMYVLAEEIEHTIQQSVGPVSSRSRIQDIPVSDPSDHFERQATSVAARVMGGQSVVTRAGGERPRVRRIPSAPLVLQRAIGDGGEVNQKVKDGRGAIFIIIGKEEGSTGTSYRLQAAEGLSASFSVESKNDDYHLATETADSIMLDVPVVPIKKRKEPDEPLPEATEKGIRELLDAKETGFIGKIMAVLEEDQPPFDEDLADALQKEMSSLSFGQGRALANALTKWKSPETGSEGGGRAKKRQRRAKKTKADTRRKSVQAYEGSTEDSDLSENEMDSQTLYTRHQLTATALVNPTHVPTKDDIEKRGLSLKDYLTNLHHANTYLGILFGGQFVPRTIRGEPNIYAHRQKLPEVSGAGIETDKRTRQINTYIQQRDDPSNESENREEAASTVRDLFEQIFFGNTINFAEGEKEQTLVEQRETIKKDLQKRKSTTREAASIDLLGRKAMTGLRKGTVDVTGGDAEQKLLSSAVWKGLLARVQKAIVAFKHKKGEQADLTLRGSRVELLLNRSSCLGCGKALTLALIQFWTDLALSIGVGSWQEARDAYKDHQLFTIAFPVIYEYDKEAKKQFANIKAIMEGLKDAGWNIRIPQSNLVLNDHAKKNQEQLRKFL